MAVVLSAFGNSTDQLIEISNLASLGDKKYKVLLQKFFDFHTQFIFTLIKKNQPKVHSGEPSFCRKGDIKLDDAIVKNNIFQVRITSYNVCYTKLLRL